MLAAKKLGKKIGSTAGAPNAFTAKLIFWSSDGE